MEALKFNIFNFLNK